MLSATLIGSHQAEMPTLALTVTADKGGCPVLDLCRELVKRGQGDEAMTVYRGTIPAMVIPSIHQAAKLTVHEGPHGPTFKAHRPWSGGRLPKGK